MKDKIGGIVQLALSILVFVLFHFFYFKLFNLFNLKISKEIITFIGYLLICIIIFVIYYRNIKAGQHKYKSTLLNSVVYSIACFAVLIVATVLIHKFLKYIGTPKGIKVEYMFTNYFVKQFNLSFALNLIEDVIFKPFLLCVIFPLGISNIIKGTKTSAIVSGLAYALLSVLYSHYTFEGALYALLTPFVIVMLLTYLYKTNNNIWTCFITYCMYVLFGIFLVQYFI